MKKMLMSFMFVLLFAFSFGLSVQAAAVYDHEVTLDMNGGDYLHQDINNFGDKLEQGVRSQTILGIGDSTSNATNELYYLFLDQLTGDIEDYSVLYRLWDDTTSSYAGRTVLQEGTDGDAYVIFSGATGESITALDSAELSITGDIEVKAKVKFEPNESGTIVSKWDLNQQSFQLYYELDSLGTTGTLRFYWSTDGSDGIDITSGGFTVTEDTEIWLKATLDVDNGGGGYTYTLDYSYDDITYTNLSDTATAAGTTSIYDSTAPMRIGMRGTSTTDTIEARFYEAEIKNGLDGEIVASLDVTSTNQDSLKDVEGNTWIYNGDLAVGYGAPQLLMLNTSIAGASTSTYDATKLNAMINMDVDMVMINLGHNEASNDEYVDQLEDFIDSVELYTDLAPTVLITQNDHVSPRTSAQILAQSIRMDQVLLVAARNNIAVVDAGVAIDSDPTTYISADGLHPEDAGQIVWADQVYDMFKLSLSDNGLSEVTLLVEDAELIVPFDDPVKEDATFIGWYTNEALTEEWDFDTDLVQDDMTLYAKYSTSTVAGGYAVITSPNDTILFFGIAWYWYAVVGVGAYFLFGTKQGKKTLKSLGLK